MKYWQLKKLLENQRQDLNQSNNNSNVNKSSNQNLNNKSNHNNENYDSQESLDNSNKNQELNNKQKYNEQLENYYKDKIKKIKQKKEKLNKLKKQIQKISTLKNQTGKKQTGKKPLNPNITKENMDFLEQLQNIESFENREKGDRYAFGEYVENLDYESVFRTLITKFLNQRFLKKKTDLNIRSNSMEKSGGYLKWDTKQVIKHLKTKELTKVLDDKYRYKYAEGKNENIPLSFYFDMSGSMANYSSMLAVIAIELLKKKVKVLVGFNERVNFQIEKVNETLTIDDFANILINGSENNSKIVLKEIKRNIDNYLKESKAEKCVVFADFDPKDEIINLSTFCETYWFCFEDKFNNYNVNNFEGFLYKVSSLEDIIKGLIKVNTNRFKSLIYMDKERKLERS